MTTLQEYLNQTFPTPEMKKNLWSIHAYFMGKHNREKLGITDLWVRLEGGELDLSEFVNLYEVEVNGVHLSSPLTKLILGNKPNLKRLVCEGNQLTSLDFLNSLSNSEKLTLLRINNNNFQPTNIEFFSKFVNLEKLFLGTDFLVMSDLFSGKEPRMKITKNCYNRFYGSLKSLGNLTKLGELCIANTDVDEGLEYLPQTLSNLIKRAEVSGDYNGWQIENLGNLLIFDCRAQDPDAKVAKIQNQLRPFNYDVEAWQLAHPEKMLIARPELFTSLDSKDKWIKALTDKITNTQQELVQIKEQEADKVKKIARLESRIQELTKVKEVISQSTQTDPTVEPANSCPWYQEVVERLKKNFTTETREQATQTDLTSQDYEQQQKEIKELREQISKLSVKK